MTKQAKRARPLSPDERRAAILDAVIPLLIENGTAVTTAEMAAAAGIAEGTIFGVFPDKAALIHAAIAKTMDPEPIQQGLAAVSQDAPLAEQLTEAANILSRHYESVTALVAVVRSLPHDQKDHSEGHRIATESMAAVADALTELMTRHSARLTVTPRQAASLLRGLVFTNSHSFLAAEGAMDTRQLVAAITSGIVKGEAE